MSRTNKKPRIQALARASAIIDVVAESSEQGVSLSDISRATELNKTTAFNLIASLVTLRFIEQNPQSKKYILGMRNLELGRIVQQRMHILSAARPILHELCRKTNETVSLGLPGSVDFWILDSFQGSQMLHATSNLGERWPYHSTASGKAFMSRWSEPMRNIMYDSIKMTQLTPNTITDIDTLNKQLDEFYELGYALDMEENEIGVNGIATTVIDGLGEVVASISIAGPANRLTKSKMEGFSHDIIAAANQTSASLGAHSQITNNIKSRV